jgi:hypothetical protein
MARLASWSQPKADEKEAKKEKEAAEKKTKENKGKDGTLKMSTSSFEAGSIGSARSPKVSLEVPSDDRAPKTIYKKQSVLGLGLPSSLRFGTVRSAISTAASTAVDPEELPPAGTVRRTSVSSTMSLNFLTSRCPSSMASNSSSLHPPSAASGMSRLSSSSASIKWDEEGLKTVKEMRRKDREERRRNSTDSNTVLSSNPSAPVHARPYSFTPSSPVCACPCPSTPISTHLTRSCPFTPVCAHLCPSRLVCARPHLFVPVRVRLAVWMSQPGKRRSGQYSETYFMYCGLYLIAFPVRFDSNYYFVPEPFESTGLKLNFNKPVEEFNEAKAPGIATHPTVLTPITYLWLGKAAKNASLGFAPIAPPKIIPLYKQLLIELKAAGAKWVQIDEPVLVLDAGLQFESQFGSAYVELSPVVPRILLTA